MNDLKSLGKVLVTGAAGFLGGNLGSLLKSEGVVLRGVDLVQGPDFWDEFRVQDLTGGVSWPDLLSGVDTVFHLAARTHASERGHHAEEQYRRLNVELTARLVDAAVAGGVRRFVLTSSVKVLGEGGFRPASETDEPDPAGPYGRTKLEAERLLSQAGRDRGLPFTILRMPLIYGPGVTGNLGAMIRNLAAGRFPPVPDTGNRRSLVDVRDVARALALAGGHPAAAGKVFLVTDGRTYSTFQMCALIREALGRSQPHWSIPAPLLKVAAVAGSALGALGLPRLYDSEIHHKLLGSACYSSAEIERTLGFSPRHDLATSLPSMLEAMDLTQKTP